jgi:hypothetical protein
VRARGCTKVLWTVPRVSSLGEVERLPKLAHHIEGSVPWRYRYKARSALAFFFEISVVHVFLERPSSCCRTRMFALFPIAMFFVGTLVRGLRCASTCRVDVVGLTRRHATTLSDLDLLVSPCFALIASTIPYGPLAGSISDIASKYTHLTGMS